MTLSVPYVFSFFPFVLARATFFSLPFSFLGTILLSSNIWNIFQQQLTTRLIFLFCFVGGGGHIIRWEGGVKGVSLGTRRGGLVSQVNGKNIISRSKKRIFKKFSFFKNHALIF